MSHFVWGNQVHTWFPVVIINPIILKSDPSLMLSFVTSLPWALCNLSLVHLPLCLSLQGHSPLLFFNYLWEDLFPSPFHSLFPGPGIHITQLSPSGLSHHCQAFTPKQHSQWAFPSGPTSPLPIFFFYWTFLLSTHQHLCVCLHQNIGTMWEEI